MLQLLYPDFFFVKQLPNHEKVKKYFLEKNIEYKRPDGWLGKVDVTRGVLHNNDFKPLIENLSSVIKDCFSEYCLKKDFSVTYPPDTFWINRSYKGMWQEYHTHSQPNQNFSFVYYMQYDLEKDGKFSLWNSRYEQYSLSGISNVIDLNKLMISQCVKLDIREGDVIIFPAFYLHAVTCHESDIPRYTIAGNFLLK